MSESNLTRILLIEDDSDIQEVARMTLEAVGGYTVEVCSGGDEALSTVGQFAPDLILLDVMMPGMDGPTTLKQLRKLPETAGTPVIFMTAKVQTQEKELYRQLGAVDVIAKPFDPMSLATTVQEIWSRSVS